MTTAKRAVREPDKLAPATLRRVQEAIRLLEYEPDQVAAALRRGTSSTIGLVIGSIVEPFFAELTRTIVREVRDRGYTVIIADTEYRSDLSAAHLRTLSGNRIAGLIVRSGYGESNLPYLETLSKRGVGIVEVDYFTPGSPFSHVMLDNTDAVERGIAHLVEHGHRCIAPLGTYHPILNPDERVQAFPRALARHGLVVPPEFVRPVSPIELEGYKLTRELMEGPTRPTAIFALTGTMATGAFRALRDLNLRVPDDVSLVAFDDYPWMSLVKPGIDTFAQPVTQMGKDAVSVLFKHMAEENNEAPQYLRLPANMIIRGSVKRLS